MKIYEQVQQRRHIINLNLFFNHIVKKLTVKNVLSNNIASACYRKLFHQIVCI
jgi:hypothetical protein